VVRTSTLDGTCNVFCDTSSTQFTCICTLFKLPSAANGKKKRKRKKKAKLVNMKMFLEAEHVAAVPPSPTPALSPPGT
jgi:hypothetical protein